MLAALRTDHEGFHEVFVIQNLIAMRALGPHTARDGTTALGAVIGRRKLRKDACNPAHEMSA